MEEMAPDGRFERSPDQDHIRTSHDCATTTEPLGPIEVVPPNVVEMDRPRTSIPDPPRFGRHYRPEGADDESGPSANGHGLADGPVDDDGSDDENGGGLAGALASVAEPVVNAMEPIVGHVVMPVAGAIGNMLEAASGAFGVRDAIADRLMHRTPPEPLANLYEVHPDARLASPRELGFRFVPIEDIRGTAVAGAAQRGDDFLPLPPFRGSNWEARWQRIREANSRLQPLPPVDLIKYDGGYWVVDGHNRVAATLLSRGVGLDAMVVELVPMDGQVSEKPSSILPFLGETRALRTVAQGRRPAVGTRVSAPAEPAPRDEPFKDGPGPKRPAGPRTQERPNQRLPKKGDQQEEPR
jgi:hypothetical protein